ncbi:MAG: PH domain-containing protein, partial [bacterium]|nr:PH domain-containing protein [bacterium]
YLFALRSLRVWIMLMVVIVGIILFVINLAYQKEIILSPSAKVTVGILNEYDYSKTFLVFIWIFPAIISAVISSLFWGFLVWKNYIFEITENSIKIHYGIIKKTTEVIPYSTIKKIEIKRKISERLTGLVTLVFGDPEDKKMSFREMWINSKKEMGLINATYSRDLMFSSKLVSGLLPEEASKLKEVILSFEKNKIF